MKFPGLERTLKALESEIDSINILHKDWWLASDGTICGACEFVVPALAKRTNAFIDAFARMVRVPFACSVSLPASRSGGNRLLAGGSKTQALLGSRGGPICL